MSVVLLAASLLSMFQVLSKISADYFIHCGNQIIPVRLSASHYFVKDLSGIFQFSGWSRYMSSVLLSKEGTIDRIFRGLEEDFMLLDEETDFTFLDEEMESL